MAEQAGQPASASGADGNRALAALAASGIDYDVTETQRASSLEEAAHLRGIDPHDLVKSMVVRYRYPQAAPGTDEHRFVIVLVPGDRAISWKKLRAHLGTNRAAMPSAEEALEVTGFERGTITPFGAGLPVVADETVGRGRISMGAGEHGRAVFVNGAQMLEFVSADIADVTDPT